MVLSACSVNNIVAIATQVAYFQRPLPQGSASVFVIELMMKQNE